MANLVRLHGDRVELPSLAHPYSITPAVSKLQAGLEAFQALQTDGTLHGLGLAERQQVTRYLVQFGHLLFHTLFPADHFQQLAPEAPLHLALSPEWSVYPWELLNDGNQWLALSRGVQRLAEASGPADVAPSLALRSGEALRVLAVSANPLPLGPESRIARERALLGTRFVTTLPHLADMGTDERLPIAYRAVPHASLTALEQALGRHPHVLLFSGFASEEGWYLESERLTAERVPWDWLGQRLRVAVEHGLRLVVLADSLGMAQPLAAAQHTRELLRAGMEGIVRIEGRVGRDRQTGYLRALLRELAAGAPIGVAHQAAARGLFRAYEEAWDWCLLRLHPQPARSATHALAGVAPAHQAEPTPQGPGPLPDPADVSTRPFASPPAPPAFAGRRRHFDRARMQRRLLDALFPEAPSASPLVFLSGGPGSGKTHLALEMVQRLGRRFGQVHYLPQRALVPEPDTSLATDLAAAPEPEPGQRLLAALARHLGVAGAETATVVEARATLQRHCSDGIARLVILDRWEPLPGYDALVEALATLPRACHVLLLSRALPPLIPGQHVAMDPLGSDELPLLFGTELTARLQEECADPALRAALAALCGVDLFLGRLLRRAPRWPAEDALRAALQPESDAMDPAEADGGGAAGEATRWLLAWLADDALPGLPPDAAALLPAVALLPGLVHRDTLAEGSGLQRERLQSALEALAWLGWVDVWDGGRYSSLHPRLHRLLAERVLSTGALAGLQPRLLRAYRHFLTETSAALREAPAAWLRGPAPMLGTDAVSGEAVPEDCVRRLHRLGVEAVNLAELALWLTDAGEWRALELLVGDAAPLGALPELGDLSRLLGHTLLAAGARQADPVLQADALNRLAAPLVEARHAEQATPLLERALQLLQRTAGWHVLGETQRLLSRCYELMGRLDAAERLLQSSAELARQLGNAALLTHAGQGLARIWGRAGQAPSEGEGFLAQQAQFLRQTDRPLEAALLLRAQADLLARRGHWADAETHGEAVLARCREAGHAAETARTLLLLADCRLAQDDPQGALERVSEVAGSTALGPEELDEQGRLLSGICRVFEQRQQLQPALDAYLRIREVLEQIGDREALIGVLDRMGGLYFQLGERDKSTQCYEERLHLQAALLPS